MYNRGVLPPGGGECGGATTNNLINRERNGKEPLVPLTALPLLMLLIGQRGSTTLGLRRLPNFMI